MRGAQCLGSYIVSIKRAIPSLIKVFRWLCIILAAIVCGIASAEEEYKWHADIGLQLSDIGGGNEDLMSTYDGLLFTANGHVGYNLSPIVGIEAEFGLSGLQEDDIATYDPQTNFLVPPLVVDLKQNYILGLSGRLQFEVTDRLLIFAKGGVAHSKFTLTEATEIPVETIETGFNETGPSLGAGLQFYFSENSGVRLDVTRYEFDDFDNTSVSIGYSHRFGSVPY